MLVLVVVAITVLVTIKPRNGPAMNGGLTLEAAPGVRFYVGEKLVGTGKAFLTWDDFIGSDGNEPLALKLEPEPSFDVRNHQKPHGAITAELLGGRGAVFILRSNQYGNQFGNDF